MASIITNNSLLLFGLKLFWLFLLSFQITNMCYRPSPVAQQVENLPAMQETQMWVQSQGSDDPFEEEMATHSRILA